MASGAKGTIGNPYSMSEYQDLRENDSWQGIGLYSILINCASYFQSNCLNVCCKVFSRYVGASSIIERNATFSKGSIKERQLISIFTRSGI